VGVDHLDHLRGMQAAADVGRQPRHGLLAKEAEEGHEHAGTEKTVLTAHDDRFAVARIEELPPGDRRRQLWLDVLDVDHHQGVGAEQGEMAARVGKADLGHARGHWPVDADEVARQHEPFQEAMMIEGVDVRTEDKIGQFVHRFHRADIGGEGELVVDVALGHIGQWRVAGGQLLGKALQGPIERDLQAAGQQGQQGRLDRPAIDRCGQVGRVGGGGARGLAAVEEDTDVDVLTLEQGTQFEERPQLVANLRVVEIVKAEAPEHRQGLRITIKALLDGEIEVDQWHRMCCSCAVVLVFLSTQDEESRDFFLTVAMTGQERASSGCRLPGKKWGTGPHGRRVIRPETLCPKRREERLPGINQPQPLPPPAQAPLEEHLRIRPCRPVNPLPV